MECWPNHLELQKFTKVLGNSLHKYDVMSLLDYARSGTHL